MGDRAMIELVERENAPPLYLYTHWGGSDLALDVQAGLKRGEGRWNDPYLARILFCQMMDADDLHGTTGFGISTTPIDGRVLRVRLDAQTVRVNGRDYPFDEYVELPESELENWHDDC